MNLSMMNMNKDIYTPPCVVCVPLSAEEGVLISQSVEEAIIYMEMTGHEVEEYDWSQDQFNHTWE